MLKVFLNYLKSRSVILLITLFYTAVVLIVLLNRFWQYEVFYYDHGMMEGTAYQVSQFKLPLHDREYGKLPIYIDHLYPSLQLVLAPFYWINNSYETPIIVMSLLIGSSVLIAYEIAGKFIKNKLMVYSLLFAYMFYIGMQNTLIFFVHDVTIQIPFLMFLFWSLFNKKFKLFYIFLLINLGFKESFSITGFTLGIAMVIFNKEWRKHGLIVIAISFLYGYMSAQLIIPYFRYLSFGSWQQYSYLPQLPDNIFEYISRFVNTDQKKETIVTSLATFGFLPVFSWFSLPLLIQDFAQRFVLIHSESPLRQGLNLYYNANLSVLLFIGSIMSVSWLQRFKLYSNKIINWHTFLIIITVVYFHQFKYHGPLGLIYNRDFFKITENMLFMDEFVNKIPKKGKIMLQNNLAVRFTHEDLYLLLSEKHFMEVDPDVVALDFRPGQNINNFWPMDEEKMKSLAQELSSDKRYEAIYKDDRRFIFVKKNSGK